MTARVLIWGFSVDYSDGTQTTNDSPNQKTILANAGIGIRFETVDSGDPHPNTYRLTLTNDQKNTRSSPFPPRWDIEVINIDGFSLSMIGDYCETLLLLRQTQPRGETNVINTISSQLHCDEVRVHTLNELTLVQVKTREFFSDGAIAGLSSLGDVLWIKRLGSVLPVMSYRGMQVPFRTAMSSWNTLAIKTSSSGNSQFNTNVLAATFQNLKSLSKWSTSFEF